MNYNLIRETETGLLTVVGLINNSHRLKLILDTGATVTTIDSNVLYMSGFRPKDSIGTVLVETASGIIEVYVFRVAEFTALGITKHNIEICAYDFFAHNVLSEFDGVLGIDFMKSKHIL